MNLHAKITLRFFNEKDEKCFGPGIAELLELIEQTGSLRSSCAKMQMAYSKAWKLLKDCEKALGISLLQRKVGGEEGGGSILTEEGKAILLKYRSAQKQLKEINITDYPKN